MENKIIQKEITNEEIKNLIYEVRGKQVMIDSDVAMLYNYPTKRINEAVNRYNKKIFAICLHRTRNCYVSRCFKK